MPASLVKETGNEKIEVWQIDLASTGFGERLLPTGCYGKRLLSLC